MLQYFRCKNRHDFPPRARSRPWECVDFSNAHKSSHLWLVPSDLEQLARHVLGVLLLQLRAAHDLLQTSGASVEQAA